MSNMIQSRVAQPQQQQQQKKKGTDLDWLRPIGTVASAFGFPYLSMALGAYDMFNGDPSGVMKMLGGINGINGMGGQGDLLSMFKNGGGFNPSGTVGGFSNYWNGSGNSGGLDSMFQMNNPNQFDQFTSGGRWA